MVNAERNGDSKASKKEHADELYFAFHVDLHLAEQRKGHTLCHNIGQYTERCRNYQFKAESDAFGGCMSELLDPMLHSWVHSGGWWSGPAARRSRR